MADPVTAGTIRNTIVRVTACPTGAAVVSLTGRSPRIRGIARSSGTAAKRAASDKIDWPPTAVRVYAHVMRLFVMGESYPGQETEGDGSEDPPGVEMA
jgi:hypothetical protein